MKPGTGCSTSSIHSDTVLLFTILSIGILTGTASHWHVYTYIYNIVTPYKYIFWSAEKADMKWTPKKFVRNQIAFLKSK